jgi:hypothetical protein
MARRFLGWGIFDRRNGEFSTGVDTFAARTVVPPSAASCKICSERSDGCTGLEDFPHLGRASSRMTGRRSWYSLPLPYVVVYHVTENAVEISRIFHGAQDWP